MNFKNSHEKQLKIQKNYLLQEEYKFRTNLLTNATRGQILRALNDLRKTLDKNDNLLIYNAGHGWLDKAADEGYWLPVDAAPDDRNQF